MRCFCTWGSLLCTPCKAFFSFASGLSASGLLLPSFLTFLLVFFHVTTCIVPRGYPPQVSKLRLIYLYFVLLSSLCYSFRLKKAKPSQSVLQMSVRMQLICLYIISLSCLLSQWFVFQEFSSPFARNQVQYHPQTDMESLRVNVVKMFIDNQRNNFEAITEQTIVLFWFSAMKYSQGTLKGEIFPN